MTDDLALLKDDLERRIGHAADYGYKAIRSADRCNLSDAITFYLNVKAEFRNLPTYYEKNNVEQELAMDDAVVRLINVECETWNDILRSLQKNCGCRLNEG